MGDRTKPNPDWVTVAEPIWLPAEYTPKELMDQSTGARIDVTGWYYQIPHDKVLDWVRRNTEGDFDAFLEEASAKVEEWPVWKRQASGLYSQYAGDWSVDKLKSARKLVADLIRKLRHNTTVRYMSSGETGIGLEFSCPSHDRANHQHITDKSQRFIAIEVLDLVHQLKRDMQNL
jgi:hypothetical protein